MIGVSIYVLSDLNTLYTRHQTSQYRQSPQRSRERNQLPYRRSRMDDPLACVDAVKPLNAHIPAIFVASDFHNGRMFFDISERSTTIPIRVLFPVASSNGLALTSSGLT
jgi:hypothetical protein